MRLLIVLLLAIPFVAASAATLTGRTVRVTDGDTIVILSEGNVQHRIRLQGIDAPERGQAYGTKSKEHLSERVAGRFVVVKTDKRDRYGRVIGKVLVGGKDVCLEQINAPSKARRILRGESPYRVRVSHPPVSSLASVAEPKEW